MVENTSPHALASVPVGAAIGWLTVTGVGMALMTLPLSSNFLCFIVGACVSVLGASGATWLAFHEHRRKSYLWWTVGIVALVCWLATASTVWEILQPDDSLNNSVAIRCDVFLAENAYRPDRNTTIVNVGDPPTRGGAVYPITIESGLGRYAAPSKLPEGVNPIGQKCTVINYGKAQLTSIALAFNTEWIDVILAGHGSVSGGLAYAKKFAINDLDMGPLYNDTDYFVVITMSKLFVRVTLPTDATITIAGSTKAKKIRLVAPLQRMDSYFTLTPTSLPVAPPITQVRQEPPREK